jgi:hypothetical protein
MVRSFQALPPVAWAVGLGQQGDVFGDDAGLETGIGIAVALGRIGRAAAESDLPATASARNCRPSWRPAHPRHHLVERHHRRDLRRGKTEASSRVMNDTSPSVAAPAASSALADALDRSQDLSAR